MVYSQQEGSVHGTNNEAHSVHNML